MKILSIFFAVLLFPTMVAAEEWKVVQKQKNLKTGEDMLSLSSLSSETSFEDCRDWADNGGGMGLAEGTVAMDGSSIYMLVYESEGITLGCQQVTKKLLQKAITLPQKKVEEYGLALKQ